VAGLAREQVTVCLTGDGGDEIFAGYNRHAKGAALWAQLAGVSPGLRGAAAGALQACPRATGTACSRFWPRCCPRTRASVCGREAAQAGPALPCRVAPASTRPMVSAGPTPGALGADEPRTALGAAPARQLARARPVPEAAPPGLQFLDSSWYCPRTFCQAGPRRHERGAGGRAPPYLDHRVAEFAWTLTPLHARARRPGKWALRELLARFVPGPCGAPQERLRGPAGTLAARAAQILAEALIDPERLPWRATSSPRPWPAPGPEHQSGRYNANNACGPCSHVPVWRKARAFRGRGPSMRIVVGTAHAPSLVNFRARCWPRLRRAGTRFSPWPRPNRRRRGHMGGPARPGHRAHVLSAGTRGGRNPCATCAACSPCATRLPRPPARDRVLPDAIKPVLYGSQAARWAKVRRHGLASSRGLATPLAGFPTRWRRTFPGSGRPWAAAASPSW
jgi:hypothetical protein